jgi:predicted Zn-dependent protease
MADRRISTLIGVVIALLVCAVLWDAFIPPPRRSRPPAAHAPDSVGQRAVAAPAPGPPDTAAVAAPARPPAQPPTGGAAQVSYIDLLARAESRRRIRASAGYTYLDQIVAESSDSALHRWDDRASRPVRVYLPGSTAANFHPEFVDAIRSGFQQWQDAGVPVRFDVGADSADADVRFQWKVQFDIERTGQTDLAWDQDGHILSGVVTMATFDPKGRALSVDDVRVVALHEIGHVLGLDHSSDSTDIMFARTQVRELSARDIRTAQMLYHLASGSLR